MKHKLRFPGKLWPFGGEKEPPLPKPFLPEYSPLSEAKGLWHEYKIAIIIFIAALIILLGNVFIYAQTTVSKGLPIGEKVPDIVLNNIINYSSKTAKLSDFRGKVLILDFWATWCSGCILAMPKMEALEKQFDGKLQILAVDDEDEGRVRKFFETKSAPDGKKFHFATVFADKDLNHLFTHRVIPHCVWINEDGIVIAITDADEVTAAHIQRVLAQEHPAFAAKRDIDESRPLFLDTNFKLNDVAQYSVLVKAHYPGLGSSSPLRMGGDSVRGRAFTNMTLLAIYQSVMREMFARRNERYNSKRLIFNGLSGPSATSIIADSTGIGAIYNYDFILPAQRSDSLYSYMLANLNRSTGYRGRIERRKVKCLVLKVKNARNISSKGETKENSLFYARPARLTNEPLDFLILRLNSLPGITLPIIDETGFTGNVDLELSGSLDADTITRELAKYGLILEAAERKIDTFVLDGPIHN